MFAVAGLVVLTALAVWRLSQGPVPLDLLRPYVERGLTTADGSIRLVARSMSLNWAGWDRTLEIHVQTVEAISAQGQVIATIPDAAVKLSLVSLVTGELAPTSIQLEKLRLHVAIEQDGRLNYGLDKQSSDSSDQIVALLFEQLLNGGGDSAIRKLDRVSIAGAEIVFEDKPRNLTWRAPNADIALYRDAEGVLGEATMELDVGQQRSTVNVRALYTRNRDRLAVALNFEGLRPSAFATIDPSLGRLAAFDVPLSGTVDAVLSGQGDLRSVTVNMAGGAGTIDMPDLLGEARSVQSVALRGEVNLAARTLALDDARVVLGTTTVAASGKGRFDSAGLDLQADIAIDGFAGADLARYWPPNLAPGGRRWALANVSQGTARDIALKLALKGPLDDPDRLEATVVSGGMKFSDVTVQYLAPMPPVEGVSGHATFGPTQAAFHIDTGRLGDINLDGADVTLVNLNSADERALIDMSATGPFASIVRLLSHPKVGIPPSSVIAPSRAGGQIAARLLLQFPLLDGLTMKQVEFSASASTRALSIKDAVPGVDLTDGAVTLQLNGQELDVRGKAKVGGIASDVSWHENFGRTVGFRRRYQLKATLDVAELARLGVPLAPYVSGPIGVTAIFQDNLAGGGVLDASLDLKQVVLSMPELGWSKPAGKDAGAKLSFEVHQGKRPSEFDVQLATGDVDLRGKLGLGANGISQVSFDRLISGRNDLSGSLTRTESGFALVLKGNSFDAAPYLADDSAPQAQAKPPAAVKPPSGPILDIDLNLRRLLTKRGEIDNVVGRLHMQGGRLLNGSVTARALPDATLQLDVRPINQGRSLTLTATDIGAVLKSLGWLEGMFGGKARLDAAFDDTKPGSPLRGRLTIDSYKLQKTPVVGDVLTVGALTDALSSFSGNGIEFNQLVAPFTWESGVLTLRGARTAGSSIGITASGRINTNNDTVQISGVIVPAYVLNSVLGNIPLLGPLILGGPGKGLFSINYAVEGPISQPKVTTNPLSVLAPGFLSNIFGGGTPDDENLESGQPPRPPNEPPRQ